MVLEVVAALKQDVNSALTCLSVTVPLVVHANSKEMCANVHFVPCISHEMSDTVLWVVLWDFSFA